MDMLNHLQKLVSGDPSEPSDAELRRELQTAYSAEAETPTAPALLLDRLLAQAEATPQLAPVGAVVAETEQEEEVLEEKKNPVPVRRPWWVRLLSFGRIPGRVPRSRRVAGQFQSDLYHEYVEFHLRQVVNSASRMRPL